MYGPPESLSILDIDVPTPKDQEILVRVRASTVNRTDCGVLSGKPYIFRFFVGWPRPRHLATGTDFAGEVVEVGRGVQKWKIGDRVTGFMDHGLGTHAQFAVISEKTPMIKTPNALTDAEATACWEGAHYARNFLNKVALKTGNRVLVIGATGAIGSAAVQLLKDIGVHVTATCASPYIDRVKNLGADRVIDYLKEDFTKTSDRYDFIFDSVGKSSFGVCKPLLESHGVYISSELGPRAENLYLPFITRLIGGKRVIFPFPYNIEETLAQVSRLVERGLFRPLIDRTYRLEQIREAFEYVASGRKIGNVIIEMD